MHDSLAAMQALLATAYVFCAALQSAQQGGAHTITYAQFALVQDTRPRTADWPPLQEGYHIYAVLAIRCATLAWPG